MEGKEITEKIEKNIKKWGIFYSSRKEVIDTLDDEKRLKLYDRITAYMLYEKELEIDWICKTISLLIKPQIDANNRKRENWKSKKKQKKANDKQMTSKWQAKEKERIRIKDKEKDKEKEKENDKEKEKKPRKILKNISKEEFKEKITEVVKMKIEDGYDIKSLNEQANMCWLYYQEKNGIKIASTTFNNWLNKAIEIWTLKRVKRVTPIATLD